MKDLLIFGMELEDISEPFSIGNLTIYPNFDLGKYLKGYDPADVAFIIDAGAIYSEYKYERAGDLDARLYSLKPQDECLLPFRLFKPGWIVARPVMPVVKHNGMEMRGDISEIPLTQLWAEPLVYKLREKEITQIQEIHQRLMTMSEGYLKVALRRFTRSYNYWAQDELDDCLVDLVIALESITSRGGDSIRQSMALRTALFLGDNLNERKDLGQKVKEFYDLRCDIVHGGEKRQKKSEQYYYQKFDNLEELRTIVRGAINASIRILDLAGEQIAKSSRRPKTMAEIMDDYLFENLRAGSLKL